MIKHNSILPNSVVDTAGRRRIQQRLAIAAVESWSGLAGSLQRISDSANYVFSFIESGKKRYLRLTPGNQRTKNQIEAELDFIAFLRQNGISAALPVPSVSGKLVEEINHAEASLFACVFEEAEGERFRYDSSAEFNKEHFRLRGRTLGQIHAISKIYAPSVDRRRFAWDEDELLLETNEFLPGSEKIVWGEYNKLKARLQEFPKSAETFGLIHGDFGETNYRYEAARLNIFDFDDCCYHWFVYDLAVTIYPHGWRKEGLQLLDWLLEGYCENMPLEVRAADIMMFCQWRLIYMFLVYARKWGFRNLSAEQSAWQAKKRENIDRGYKWQI